MTVATTLAPHGPQAPLRAARVPSGTPGSPAPTDALTALLGAFPDSLSPEPEAAPRPHTLHGPHEALDRAVLQFTACGRTQRQIATLLLIDHVLIVRSAARLRDAYGASNPAHVVARALACGDIVRGRCGAPRLTVLQRENLALIAAGLSNAEVGARLGVSQGGAVSQATRLMSLFEVGCRAELVVEAYRCRILVASADGRGLVLAGGAP